MSTSLRKYLFILSLVSIIFVVWKFHNLKNTRNNFIEVSLKFHEVSLLLSLMKFRKVSAMKLPNHTHTHVSLLVSRDKPAAKRLVPQNVPVKKDLPV